MPRNAQIIRQWHLLRRLEGSNGLSLNQLVESVLDDYPKNARTLRRDLEAVEALGFPLVLERQPLFSKKVATWLKDNSGTPPKRRFP
jgi:predicted DNA-binding transcriptional regulator YafY